MSGQSRCRESDKPPLVSLALAERGFIGTSRLGVARHAGSVRRRPYGQRSSLGRVQVTKQR